MLKTNWIFFKNSGSENNLMRSRVLGPLGTVPGHHPTSNALCCHFFHPLCSVGPPLHYTNILTVAQLAFLSLFYPANRCQSDVPKSKIREMNLHLNKKAAWLTSTHWTESCCQHSMRTSRIDPLQKFLTCWSFQFTLCFLDLNNISECWTVGHRIWVGSPMWYTVGMNFWILFSTLKIHVNFVLFRNSCFNIFKTSSMT